MILKKLIVPFSFVILLFSSYSITAQASKSQLRAKLIVKIASEFKWEDNINQSFFQIAILNDKPLFDELNDQYGDLTIQETPITFTFFDSSKFDNTFNIIYANKVYGVSEAEIINTIDNKNTIFIGENYEFNTCMVSLAETSDDIILGLNKRKLKKAGFDIPKNLKKTSIKSVLKWYRTKPESESNIGLTIHDTEVSENDTSDTEGLELFYFMQYIRNLEAKMEEENKFMDQKIADLDSLEKQLRKQYQKHTVQQTTIVSHEQTIEDQANQIQLRDETILAHKKIAFLLIAVVTLILLIVGLLVRSNYIKKRHVKLLAEKNAEIQDQAKEIEQLVYIASHDLQTPVDTIVGFTDLLQHKLEGTLSPSDVINMTFIKDSSERMRHLIKDLLEYSKISQRKSNERFNLEHLIIDVTNDLQSKLNVADAKIILDGDEKLMLTGRKTEIRLLFQNLIENAVKFKKDGVKPHIEIVFNQKHLSTEEIITTCSVADNGIGIENKHNETVFEIFSRLHLEEEYEGTGIGLAHCKKIVQKHGGKIWLDQKHTSGAKFNFTLQDQRISRE